MGDGYQPIQVASCCLSQIPPIQSSPILLMSQTLLHLRNLVARGFFLLAHSLTIFANAACTAVGISFELPTQEYGAETQPEIYSRSLVVNESQTHLCVLPYGVLDENSSHTLGTDPPQPRRSNRCPRCPALPCLQIFSTSPSSARRIKLLCQSLDFLFYGVVVPDVPVPPETLSVRRINAEQA